MVMVSDPVVPEFAAVMVLSPIFERVILPVQAPSSVNSPWAIEAGEIDPSSVDRGVGPETLVVVLPPASLAVMVTENPVPAVAEAGASTTKLAKAPAVISKLSEVAVVNPAEVASRV